MEMHAVDRLQRGVVDSGPHGGKVFRREAERLQVGKAPVGLAQRRLARDALTVSGNAVLLPPFGFQYVSVAEPYLGVGRVLLEQLGVNGARPCALTHAAQHHGMEVAVTGVAGLHFQQALYLCQCCRRFVTTMQQHGEVIAGRGEGRCQLETACQQAVGGFVLPAPHRHLRQHADGGHVGRCLLQVVFEQALRPRHVVGEHRRGRLLECRAAGSELDMARIGFISAGSVAYRHKMVGKNSPGFGVRRVEPQGMAQGGNGCVAAPGGSQSQGEFELGRRPISRELYQRLQQYQRRRRLPGEPPRGRQQQGGRRMPGNYPQDFFGLLGGKRRTLLE